MEKRLYDEMFRVEQTHWWFVAKRKIILYLLEKLLPAVSYPQRELHVCDLGCGCGATLVALRQKYDATGMDSSNDAISYCKERGLNIQKGELPSSVPYKENYFDAVLMLDVLEHVDDDDGGTETAISLLKPGGILICTVPAYPWLWSGHDEIHHHKRRYDMDRFRRLLSFPYTVPIICSYFNTFFFPFAFIQRLTYKALNIRKKGSTLSGTPEILNKILSEIFAFERFLLVRMPFPFGLSLIGVIRKKA